MNGQPRQTAGRPDGGQFAGVQRPEGDVTLGAPPLRGLVATIAGRHLTDDEAADRLGRVEIAMTVEPGNAYASRLVHAVGAARAAELIRARDVDAIAAVLSEDWPSLDADLLREDADRWQTLPGRAVEVALTRAGRSGIQLSAPDDREWPAGFNDLGHEAPLALFTKGDRDMLAHLGEAITIAGDVNATGYGEHVAIMFASEVAEGGRAVVASGQSGIAASAHRATMAAGGKAIAIVAGGVGRPSRGMSDGMYENLVKRGVMVSAQPPGTQPVRARSVYSRKLLAAATRSTVIIEAGERSQSLLLARDALRLGRAVGAVPGPVTSATSAGTNRLLGEGAAPILTASDIETLASRTHTES